MVVSLAPQDCSLGRDDKLATMLSAVLDSEHSEVAFVDHLVSPTHASQFRPAPRRPVVESGLLRPPRPAESVSPRRFSSCKGRAKGCVCSFLKSGPRLDPPAERIRS